MSRLDSAIRRLMAQRDCLNYLADQIRGIPGVILEVGLGNGRTYDHLRELLPERRIIVFDRQIDAHPDCIPPTNDMVLGDFRKTLPKFTADHSGQAALIHVDLGTGNEKQSQELAHHLTGDIVTLLASGGYVASDQPLVHSELTFVPLPVGVSEERYFIHRKGVYIS